MKHLLILGRPGTGKTTLLKRLIATMRHHPIDGFLTEELQEEERMGFWLSSLDGRQMLLAHRALDHGPRVGPYRVNVSVLDDVAVSVIQRAMRSAVILFLDELGKMEFCSTRFEDAVQAAFDRGPSVVATAGLSHLPFVTRLKSRRDIELIPLTSSNRQVVEEELSTRLRLRCSPDAIVQALHQRAAQICQMIAEGLVPHLDIDIQQAALRDAVTHAFPDHPQLYHLLYELQFRRLWQQFRHH